MQCWIAFSCLLVIVYAEPRENEDACAMPCSGEEYNCMGGRCYCASGFVLSLLHTKCVKCQGLGEKCNIHRRCCKWSEEGASLQCFQGTCQNCYDAYGNWACSAAIDRYMLVSISEVAVGTVLVLGIIATLLLITKLCATENFWARNSVYNEDSRLSIGSLQQHVEERLRDPPPRYTRTPPPDAAVYPAPFFVNAEFVHDSSIPPPVYTAEAAVHKNEYNTTNPTVHM